MPPRYLQTKAILTILALLPARIASAGQCPDTDKARKWSEIRYLGGAPGGPPRSPAGSAWRAEKWNDVLGISADCISIAVAKGGTVAIDSHTVVAVIYAGTRYRAPTAEIVAGIAALGPLGIGFLFTTRERYILLEYAPPGRESAAGVLIHVKKKDHFDQITQTLHSVLKLQPASQTKGPPAGP